MPPTCVLYIHVSMRVCWRLRWSAHRKHIYTKSILGMRRTPAQQHTIASADVNAPCTRAWCRMFVYLLSALAQARALVGTLALALNSRAMSPRCVWEYVCLYICM